MGNWTNEEIAEKTEHEGLDYMIMYYLDADKIADPKMKSLWKKANKVLTEIQEILDEARNEYSDDDNN